MKVVVTIEGGVVTHILTDTPGIQVAVVDYDTEGTEKTDPNLKTIVWTNGGKTEAFARVEDADLDMDTVDDIWKVAEL